MRQGDPLSHAVLTTILVYDLRQLRLDLQIFFYADDVLLYIPGTRSEVAGTMEVIVWRFLVYGNFFGLRVNVSETKLVLRKHKVHSSELRFTREWRCVAPSEIWVYS